MPEEQNATSNTSTTTNDAFMDEVQNRLLGQADVISSTDTNLEKTFRDAQSGIRRAQEASAQRIESEFGRERGFVLDDAERLTTNFSEGRSGFGTQMAAFRRIVETTDRNLNDLEQRKQELILQGEASAAQQISALQIQALEFRQNSQQRVFENLLNVGNFAAARDEAQLARQQFQEGIRQFNESFNFTKQQDLRAQEQLIKDNEFREKEFELALDEFELGKRFTNAQIAKMYNDITPTPTSDGVVLPMSGEAGTDIKFVPNGDLTAKQQEQVNTAMGAIGLINQLEAYYSAAAGEEYSGTGAGAVSRVKGVFRMFAQATGSGVPLTGESGENWAIYKRFLDSNRAPIAKGIKGEVGNLAQQEQQNALKSFPNEFSSPREAQAAFQAIREQITGNLSNLGTVNSSQQNNNPLGI